MPAAKNKPSSKRRSGTKGTKRTRRLRPRGKGIATAQALAAAASSALSEVSAARNQLKQHPKPDAKPVLVHGPWRVAQRILIANGDELRRRKEVVAVGLGHRRKAGALTDEPCIVVYVTSKLRERDKLADAGHTPLPLELRLGRHRVGVDVVQLVGIKPLASAGDSVGRTEQPTTLGTIGAFGVDQASGTSVAFTAGHVVKNVGAITSSPSVRQDPAAPRLGTVLRTSPATDAAAIQLDPGVTGSNQLPFGPIAGWRPVIDADLHSVVSMYAARSQGQSGFIEAIDVSISTSGLASAFLVLIDAQEGDSGAALVDVHGAVLGLLVGGGAGEHGNLCVATPVTKFLADLNCSL